MFVRLCAILPYKAYCSEWFVIPVHGGSIAFKYKMGGLRVMVAKDCIDGRRDAQFQQLLGSANPVSCRRVEGYVEWGAWRSLAVASPVKLTWNAQPLWPYL